MATSRRSKPDLHVRLPRRSSDGTSSLPSSVPDLPPISALFQIDFDVKAGYTLSWKASHPDVELEGVVEYKSLPSGLHTVSDDLIYFVHDGFAGLSAFVNVPCEDAEARNARMIAVGVLVPLSYGRLGRVWKHADSLKAMAQRLATSREEPKVLEEYWESNRAREDMATAKNSLIDSPSVTFQTPQPQPTTPRRQRQIRNRSVSDGNVAATAGHILSPFHPAWSLGALLDTFGPLIFPIYRAALLRKRILISCHAPVQEVNNFVYDISILSNIPLSTYEQLPAGCPPHRYRPLFTVGVNDIAFLEECSRPRPQNGDIEETQPEEGTGWIACTTDSILAMKETLWDMLITMPPAYATAAKEHKWPTVECPKGVLVKATQRDLRRYRALRAALSRMQLPTQTDSSSNAAESAPSSPTTPRSQKPADDDVGESADTEDIVEPVSWTALAYNGFMWWASAGEQARSQEAEELASDSSLLEDFTSPSMSMSMSGPSPRSAGADLTSSLGSLTARRPSLSTGIDEGRVELAVISYFHRLTSQILERAGDIIDSHDDAQDIGLESSGEEEEDALLETDEDEVGIRIDSEAVRSLGLDVWSRVDKEFVKELFETWFGRTASMVERRVDICGVRVC